MKKSLVILVLLLMKGVSAFSGVSPGSYEVNFEPYLEKDFVFNFFFEEGVVSEIYVGGDLAKYVFLDKKEIIGGERVVATLKLPEKIDSYGENRIRIGAKQISFDGGGVGIVSDAGGIIKIFVPYPGKNAQVKLNIPHKNIGETLEINLKIINSGNESFFARPLVQLFKQEESLMEIDFDEVFIEPLLSHNEKKFLSTEGLSFGEYGGVVLLDYGAESFARDEIFFRLGEFLVNITGYSKEIGKSDLERFEVEIENLGNKEMNSVYIKVLLDNKTFISPIFRLAPWKEKKSGVFVDSSNIKGKETEVLIEVHYDDEVVFEKVFIQVIDSKSFLSVVLIILIAFFILLIIYLKLYREYL